MKRTDSNCPLRLNVVGIVEMAVTRKRDERVAQAEDWIALEQAFGTVMRVASRAAAVSPATLMGMGHGIAVHPDRDYVIALLDIVNYNAAPASGQAYWKALARAEREQQAFTSLDPTRRNQIVKLLEDIRSDPEKAAREHADEWHRATEGRVLSMPRFELTPAGFEATYRSVFLDVEAVWAHTMRLLAAPPFSGQLRRCELPSCGRFFLFVPERPGPPPLYCIDNSGACSKEAARLKTMARVRKHRAGKAARRPK